MNRNYPQVFVRNARAMNNYIIPKYIEEHRAEIIKVNRKGSCLCEITTINGMIIIMTDSTYESWCMGRTYYLGDDLYRSDHKLQVKEDKDE